MNELTINFSDADQHIGLGIQLDHTISLEQNVEKIIDTFKRFRRSYPDGKVIGIEFRGAIVRPASDCENGREEVLSALVHLLDEINSWIIANSRINDHVSEEEPAEFEKQEPAFWKHPSKNITEESVSEPKEVPYGSNSD